MAEVEKMVELLKRYCPMCGLDTRHAVLSRVLYGGAVREEVFSACALCNGDGFWGLRLSEESVGEPVSAGALPGV